MPKMPGTRVNLDTEILCHKCKRVSKVSQLNRKDGNKFPKSEGEGYWQEYFYYCSCDNKSPLVWDQGDGEPFIPHLVNAEIAPEALSIEICDTCKEKMGTNDDCMECFNFKFYHEFPDATFEEC